MKLPATPSTASALGTLQARWSQLAARERTLLALAAALIACALLWLALLAPALGTVRTSGAQAKALDAQLQHMRSLQSQAKALQQQAPLGYEDALRALNQATQQTLGGTAQISVSAERANVRLQATGADALAQWLAQARLNARSSPLEAHLTRLSTPAGATWSGTLVMSLPQR